MAAESHVCHICGWGHTGARKLVVPACERVRLPRLESVSNRPRASMAVSRRHSRYIFWDTHQCCEYADERMVSVPSRCAGLSVEVLLSHALLGLGGGNDPLLVLVVEPCFSGLVRGGFC